MKWMIVAALLTAAGAGTGLAQDPQPMPPDSGRPMGPPMGMRQGPDAERARQLRQQIEERFGRMVRTELELNDRDMQRLREAMRANQDRRVALNRRDMDVRRAIGEQMQPGVGANSDSLNRLLGTQMSLRTERARSDEQFLRDLNFLPPVKRARFMMILGRFEQRMGEVQQRLRQGRPDGQPGMRPGGQGPGAGQGPAGPRPRGRPGGQRPPQRGPAFDSGTV